MFSAAPLRAKAMPRSRTSGARFWPLRDLTAAISSALVASGFSLPTLILGYFAWKA